MTTGPEAARGAADAPVPYPRTPAEIITVLAHYHRAEIARMAGWRDRIDRTTNWAITVIAAMLSVSLSTPTAHHGVLLFAMLLVLLLLGIEARRYRFFDVYRHRVRRLERCYYAQVFAPRPDQPGNWGAALGADLRHPEFHISLADAFARRLRRNYGWMFVILALAWVLKITSARLQEAGRGEMVHSAGEVVGNAALGPLPGWLVLGAVALFYGWLLAVGLSAGRRDGEDGQVHV
ncbi:MAG: DUF2270 domain-containing protein [Methylobacterium sp.]|uniref:DUF2270 domain-containing protein n=1 Tax=Methylobacterium sp. TaxID=409 RepID=UPI00258B2520|nr:DUF2270 domain-containing protein [Methylobacterium sp.]MBY0299868.1 DUF2270 domain-containing protein [Methylobacterium sp.]